MPKRTDLKKIMVIGSGPIVIGQACEFDYSGTQGIKALKEEGYEVVLVNSNPATIMTDPGLADRTYIEPIEPETVAAIVRKERPCAILPTLGGQTGLNTALALAKSGVLAECGTELIGARAEVMREGRKPRAVPSGDGKHRPQGPSERQSPTIWTTCAASAATMPFPLIIRPAFTLGGTGGGVAYNHGRPGGNRGVAAWTASPASEVHGRAVRSSGWKEFEMEVMRDTDGQLRDRVLHRKRGRLWACTPATPSPWPRRMTLTDRRISEDARRLPRHHARNRCGNRRIERAVRRQSS